MLTKISFAVSLFLILSSAHVSSATASENQASKKKAVGTLWPDDKSCSNDKALLIAIESDGESYKIASCANMVARWQSGNSVKKAMKVTLGTTPSSIGSQKMNLRRLLTVRRDDLRPLSGTG